MAKPLVAIVGRPNVGKSTFFNKIAGRRISIVEDVPGVTRDRIYADVEWMGRRFSMVDTGGLDMRSEDVLLSQMPAELMGVTLDTYWVQAAGADVLAWIDSLAGRIPCLHLKDMAVCGFQQRFAPVGEGNMDFARILQHAQEAGVEHILVEQDDCYGESPFDCLGRSLKHVREMGY